VVILVIELGQVIPNINQRFSIEDLRVQNIFNGIDGNIIVTIPHVVLGTSQRVNSARISVIIEVNTDNKIGYMVYKRIECHTDSPSLPNTGEVRNEAGDTQGPCANQ
jgi:hypothetical protein